jgi:hypothetical protein
MKRGRENNSKQLLALGESSKSDQRKVVKAIYPKDEVEDEDDVSEEGDSAAPVVLAADSDGAIRRRRMHGEDHSKRIKICNQQYNIRFHH